MQYDMEADWHLLNTCNYRCAYCFSPSLGEKLTVHAEPELWTELSVGNTAPPYYGRRADPYFRFSELCQKLVRNATGVSKNSGVSQLSKWRMGDGNGSFDRYDRTPILPPL